MKELELKIFGARLKKVAQRDFGGVGKLGELLGLKNISNYLNGSREPGLRVIYRLHQVGIDINKLLETEERAKMEKTKEKELEETKNENDKLKIMIYDMNEKILKLEKDNEKLLSQIVVLDKAYKLKKGSGP